MKTLRPVHDDPFEDLNINPGDPIYLTQPLDVRVPLTLEGMRFLGLKGPEAVDAEAFRVAARGYSARVQAPAGTSFDVYGLTCDRGTIGVTVGSLSGNALGTVVLPTYMLGTLAQDVSDEGVPRTGLRGIDVLVDYETPSVRAEDRFKGVDAQVVADIEAIAQLYAGKGNFSVVPTGVSGYMITKYGLGPREMGPSLHVDVDCSSSRQKIAIRSGLVGSHGPITDLGLLEGKSYDDGSMLLGFALQATKSEVVALP